MSESITKPNTIETFMKANTDLRISADTIKEFQTQIDVIATSITKESEKQAKAAGRSTIMPADIKSALSNISGSAADLPTLFKQLEKLNAKDTANISAMIQTWLNTH
jgi:histone H3/H4